MTFKLGITIDDNISVTDTVYTLIICCISLSTVMVSHANIDSQEIYLYISTGNAICVLQLHLSNAH